MKEEEMTIQKEQVANIVKEFGASANDTGNCSVQVALLTERLNNLNNHFKNNKLDHHSRVGLMKLVGQRRRLLRYLHRKNPEEYKQVIAKLGLRK